MLVYKIINYFKTFLGLFIFFLNKRKINYKDKPIITGLPIILLYPKTKLILGKKVTFNSNIFTYHLHMNSPLKILIDKTDAIINIGDHTRLNGCCIHARGKITIGKNCLIAANTQIFDNNGHDLSMEKPSNRVNTKGVTKPVEIGDNVWIGYNCIVMPGVKIGSGSVISANSVVNIDIPKNCIAGGNPIKIIKNYD